MITPVSLLGWNSKTPSIWAPLYLLHSRMIAQNQIRTERGRWALHWSHGEVAKMGDSKLPQLQTYHVKKRTGQSGSRKEEIMEEKVLVLVNTEGIPVMRLLGSKISIFSARSKASGDTLGNFCENGCLGTQGSCLTYFLALSLRRNPRSESSGEPNSYFGITMKIFISHPHNNIH